MVDDAAVPVLNKCDLKGVTQPIYVGRAALPLSCLTGEGIAELLDRLAEHARSCWRPVTSLSLTRAPPRGSSGCACGTVALHLGACRHRIGTVG